ncbi:hypothetical protein LAUMK4_04339 [Mycobacterium persicum]|uniref:Mutator family transposase n=1 Tax=Mycobacterium persicum TaxID=1487726 RepID=A0ABY6RNB2_9MYCO|nr:hypothetical protein LAUMK15_04747 [Mycobacterium persicum]VAZ98754.1 hypothetical protein LAUMK4_04339 [Mycobacterium persicum]
MPLVVATGVSIDGTREVLGTAVGDSETYEFWREFLASLRARGLSGVHLVISDAHAGLKAAVHNLSPGRRGNAGRCISCVSCAPQYRPNTPRR